MPNELLDSSSSCCGMDGLKALWWAVPLIAVTPCLLCVLVEETRA